MIFLAWAGHWPAQAALMRKLLKETVLEIMAERINVSIRSVYFHYFYFLSEI